MWKERDTGWGMGGSGVAQELVGVRRVRALTWRLTFLLKGLLPG